MYATIRNRKHPKYTNDLLAYGALIVRGAGDYKGPGWLSYDFQFRRLAAARGNLGDRGKKDVSLWNDTVCKPDTSLMGPSTRNPVKPSPEDSKASQKRRSMWPSGGNQAKKPRATSREKQWRSSVCFPFSYSGKCPREKCDFLHICYDFRGTTPKLHALRRNLD